ncbi:MAG: CBS domain-containing protein [Acidobacteria bacterium]|jgi:CBS domain-containing protein|nr:CBS domain-containing protein [Acidobacteriota bacterium]
MKVKDVMKTNVSFCSTEDSLMKAAEVMRHRDCGVVPIVDEDKKVVGMLTDRDLCLAVVARNRKASDVKTEELLRGKAIVCAADDKVEDALRKMRKYQVKRLAAIGADGEVVGILSVTDVLQLAVRKDKKLKKKVYATLKAIFKPRPIVLREVSVSEENS